MEFDLNDKMIRQVAAFAKKNDLMVNLDVLAFTKAMQMASALVK